MTSKNKRRLSIIKTYALGWGIAFVFFSIVRGEGTEELGAVKMEVWRAMIVSMILGPIFGSISGIAQVLTEEYGYKKISILKLLLLRIAFAILVLAFMILVAFTIYGQDMSFLDFAFEPGSFAIYLYILTVDVFLFALRQINLFFGSNNLRKLFTGRYYTPRDEERVFMFIDLKDSTSHAERLGHIAYSKLIQDCFVDLGVVVENEAEIYQYVGDEAILTWKKKDGIKDQNCLKAYYNFRDQLEGRKEYYSKTYDCMPQFKAGAHSGIITVTEVGKYKKEIAYHGDTINTAARIQGKSKELGKELLISEELKNEVESLGFDFELLGKVELKGKEKELAIFSVNSKAQ